MNRRATTVSHGTTRNAPFAALLLAGTCVSSLRAQEDDKTLRVFVSPSDGAEAVKPWGSYSMAPIVDASKVRPMDAGLPSANENLLSRRMA